MIMDNTRRGDRWKTGLERLNDVLYSVFLSTSKYKPDQPSYRYSYHLYPAFAIKHSVNVQHERKRHRGTLNDSLTSPAATLIGRSVPLLPFMSMDMSQDNSVCRSEAIATSERSCIEEDLRGFLRRCRYL